MTIESPDPEPAQSGSAAGATLGEADKALKVSEARYRRLFEAAKDGILLLNSVTGQIEDANPFLIELLGYSREELLGKTIWEIGAFKDTALSETAFAQLQANRYIRYDHLPLVTTRGESISVEFVSNVYDCAGVDVIQCNIRDNTKRRLAEIALRASTRALTLISQSNMALVTATTEAQLLAEICRITVQAGGYRMAWIGEATADLNKTISVKAMFGDEKSYLQSVTHTWADAPSGSGPTGRAIRSGRSQFDNYYKPDETITMWRAEATRRGYHACLAIPIHVAGSPIVCLTIYSGRPEAWVESERALLEELASDLAYGISALRTAIRSRSQERQIQVSLEQAIVAISRTVEARDPYTAGHEVRVAALCRRLAAEFGLSADRTHGLYLAASIHDLGKIGLPAEILGKPRRLTAPEFAMIKQHPTIGADILKGIDFPWPIAAIIEQHHERIDGSGYPQRLRCADLLLESRILAVADMVEAMASHRPYRAALGIEAALQEIQAQRGITLDSEVVDACVHLFRDGGYDFVEIPADAIEASPSAGA